MALRFPVALPMLLYHGQSFGQRVQPCLGLALFAVGLGEQDKIIRPSDFCPRGPPRGYTLVLLGNAIRQLSLLSQGPAPQNTAPRLPEGKPLLARKRHEGLGPRLRGLPLPAVLMQRGRKVQG